MKKLKLVCESCGIEITDKHAMESLIDCTCSECGELAWKEVTIKLQRIGFNGN